VIEAEVHSSLRDFLRTQNERNWPHHLTMARLVARALRLGRPALIQTGSSINRYCLSYLMPLLLKDASAVLVAPSWVQKYLMESEIPQLQAWLQTDRQVRIGDYWQTSDNLLLTTPETWLKDRIECQERFPSHLPTIIDRADALEAWTRNLLTIEINLSDWNRSISEFPDAAELIRNTRVKLTKTIFAHPENPYQCYILDDEECSYLASMCRNLADRKALTPKFKQFWHKWQQIDRILWATRNIDRGLFTIHLAPIEVADALNPIWSQQPLVIIGSSLDLEANAISYRQQLGLKDLDLLCLKFSPNRQQERIQLYLPDRLPMHNTPQFRQACIEQTRTLVALSCNRSMFVVILVDDVPLKAQIGSCLAGEFGSRVRVEKTDLAEPEILVCSWLFWRSHQERLPIPRLLIMTTLPLPSLEDPLVASRVAYYKRQHQDWFRLYLLPTALQALQQAIVTIRESQGVVALLDNRVNFRSYGKTILAALEPWAKIDYIDPNWFAD
jgi:ATP-dependent DNA helicase DinG